MQRLLRLKNITVILGNNKIIENISFDLHLGEILTILGPNGAGKSTLAKVIIGLIRPDYGKLIFYNKINIGYVPQKLFINITIPLTVKRFMHLKPGVQTSDIIYVLKRVGADYLLNQYMKELSGGEIQRVLLARALLNQPTLLVLDEPTQGMDINAQVALYDLIHDIRLELNCTIFIISHDLNLVMAKTDKILCINKYICCSGKPEDIASNVKFISMFGNYNMKQFGIYRHYHVNNKYYVNDNNNNEKIK
uniref:Zinc ABC transporter ATP-binding protein ZnuC n=1 Tax=Candidatus Aschnera chinzeii TaxID=1485666 RepID=A0AAT9G4W3_9ENTR|nr:MAG: zinc ABC transporter ATP-binding protein ZnuC [Candidatus Aschnera chinzeii]